MPALSAGCETQDGAATASAPLPHLTRDLTGLSTIRVLAIGSAATAPFGQGGTAGNVPAQIEQILARTFRGLEVVIINRGVSGEVASSMAERLRVQVALERPDIVLWQVGTTDALARVPVEQFTATLKDTLHWLRAHGVDAVLVGLQATPSIVRDDHYLAIRKALLDVAADENVLLVRRYDAMRFIELVRDGTGMPLADTPRATKACTAEHIARAVVVSAFLGRPKAAPRR